MIKDHQIDRGVSKHADRKNRKVKRRGIIKRLLPQTLFFRSLLILIVPIVLIQVIVTTIFFDRHWSKVTSRLAFAVAGEISLLVSTIEQSENEDIANNALINAMAQKLDILVTYKPEVTLPDILPHKNTTGFIWAAMIKGTLDRELGHQLSVPYTISVDFKEKWINVRVQLTQGVLDIDIPQRRLFSSTTYIFLLWMFAASTVLLIIAVLFMRNQIRPIRRLAIAAEHFGKGRDVHNFKTEGAKEVRQAGQAFVEMKERIQRQISQRTEMLAGVSHDLRTPLTRLKLQVAMMGDSPDIYEMKKDINEMEKMIEGYLNFVRGEGQEKSVRMPLEELLREVTLAARRQGCDVSFELNELSFSPMLRPVAFKRCLTNIISNAIKYADHIWITLEKHSDKQVEIIIEDDGPGIDEDKMDEVFRPFYRVDSSRNQETGGVGLGLPIAMDIIHAHGGEIWLQKSPRGGLAVHISLPG
ncbi:MAG: HAMP domain-containing protein [Alphaproteobacteria bacterium]|nr:HAMP domain-containing protein [Alphaproteobacteria bacterium]